LQEYDKKPASGLGQIIAPYREAVEKSLAEIAQSNTQLGIFAAESLKAGGKRLRPAVALLACETLSGKYELAVPLATAYELAHSASLIQDDVIDESPLRHDGPTIQKKYGVINAMLASDVLLFKAFEAFSKYGKTKLSKAALAQLLETFSKSAIATAEGEFLEMNLASKNQVSVDEYLNVAGLKTGSLFAACAASGALVGGATKSEVDFMYEFGYNLGVSFQIKDDVLDILGNTKETGKPLMEDLKNNASNYVIIDALSKADASKKNQIAAMVLKKWFTFDEVERLVQTLKEIGSIDRAESVAMAFAERAREMLTVFPPSTAKDNLLQITYFLGVRRD